MVNGTEHTFTGTKMVTISYYHLQAGCHFLYNVCTTSFASRHAILFTMHVTAPQVNKMHGTFCKKGHN